MYVAHQAVDSTALRVACLALVIPPGCVIVDRHAAWLLGVRGTLYGRGASAEPRLRDLERRARARQGNRVIIL